MKLAIVITFGKIIYNYIKYGAGVVLSHTFALLVHMNLLPVMFEKIFSSLSM